LGEILGAEGRGTKRRPIVRATAAAAVAATGSTGRAVAIAATHHVLIRGDGGGATEVVRVR
jgi:hypothetical protein